MQNARKWVREYNGHKAAIDQKTADKNTALSTFQSDCWSKSAEARTLFDEAIKGKKKAALFAQEILAITPVAHDVEDLKTLYGTVFSGDAQQYNMLSKDRILNGTKKAEFAIIVISENFFDREWTERELNEFLNRQNRNGQKLILPILHNITVSQLQEKYPSIADIQAIDSSKYSCDQIALLFARQLIKRLKSE